METDRHGSAQSKNGALRNLAADLQSKDLLWRTMQNINEGPETRHACFNTLTFSRCSFSFDMDYNSLPFGSTIKNVVLEDQNKERFRFNEFFKGTPSIVAFFYTRCNNPNKCSATITRLVQLRKAGINLLPFL
ncbi:thioredoxin domain-containing protein [Arcticibacter eurypsychrophilus]|uniref:hypothetical protein n=1 Tax=Arcticibacter eurypsychrophilus TaxID=1434752 RepID=UPI001112EEB3|nr:hypothetical protein [Arcticibacter eurypsychrophilus]